MSFLAIDTQFRTHPRRKLFADRQTETRTAELPDRGGICLLIWFEDALQRFLIHTWPGIGNPDNELARARLVLCRFVWQRLLPHFDVDFTGAGAWALTWFLSGTARSRQFLCCVLHWGTGAGSLSRRPLGVGARRSACGRGHMRVKCVQEPRMA